MNCRIVTRDPNVIEDATAELFGPVTTLVGVPSGQAASAHSSTAIANAHALTQNFLIAPYHPYP